MKLKLFEEFQYNKIDNKDEESIFIDGYLDGFYDGWNGSGSKFDAPGIEDEVIEKGKESYWYYKNREDRKKRFDPSQLRIPYTQDDEKWNKDDSHLKK